MDSNEQINKIKIALFGNVWVVRLVKLLRYVGGGLLTWLIWKSEYMFGEQTPTQIFKSYVRDWNTKNVDVLLTVTLTFALVLFLMFIYFWLSGLLIKMLIRIDIPANQQDKIFRDKIYSVDEKTNYSVEKIDNLEITGFRGSSYVSLKGMISLKNKQSTKQIAFIFRSHKQTTLQDYLTANKFKDYLPHTNIYFREKSFFTWQKILAFILLLMSVGFFWNRYQKGKQFPDTAIGDILSGENDARKRKAQEEEEIKKAVEERRKYIVESKNIKTTWDSIGGLKDAKDKIKRNIAVIEPKRKDKNFPILPQHVLLYGPPGTGKTLLAQAAAKYSGSFFAYATGGQFAANDRRGREEKINMFLNGVVKETNGEPCVLFIDEFNQMNDNPEDYAKCTEWNTIMDGIDKQKYPGITIIAATNKAEQIDLSLLRSGRFGIKLLITYPEKKELKDIIKTNLNLFYEDICPLVPSFFGNKNKEVFVKEFTEFIFKEITENKDYEIDPNDYVSGKWNNKKQEEEKAFDENEFPPRPLFVGADIRKIIYEEAPAIARSRGREIIKEEDLKEAIKATHENNKANGLQEKEIRKFIREMLRIKGDKRSYWY